MSEAAGRAGGDPTPLSAVPEGRRARLVRVDAGHGLGTRLVAMGLVPGGELRVVSNQGHGPIVVEAMGTRIALGRGMAAKILVK